VVEQTPLAENNIEDAPIKLRMPSAGEKRQDWHRANDKVETFRVPYKRVPYKNAARPSAMILFEE